MVWGDVGTPPPQARPARGGPGVSESVGAGLALLMAASAVWLSRTDRYRPFAFTAWLLGFVTTALFFPTAWTAWAGDRPADVIGPRVIVPLVQVIMFGMGMTLTLADFARVAKMPAAVMIGFALQFTVMPVMAVAAARLFGLEPAVALGLILYGSCAGGTSSNVIAYIARANVALSVTMTTCSTLAAPIMTPLAMRLLAGEILAVDFVTMMQSIVRMIVVPVLVGLLINRYVHRMASRVVGVLPPIAMLAICLVVALTVALSRDQLLIVGPVLLAASVFHNAAGFGLGYWAARGLGLTVRDSRTVAIEVGMQNGGMATGLAFNVLHSEVAAMASAVEGPWAAMAGSGLATVWARDGHARDGRSS